MKLGERPGTERQVEAVRPVLVFQAGGAQQVTPVPGAQIDGLAEPGDIAVRELHGRGLDPLGPERFLVIPGSLRQLAQDPDHLLGDLRPGKITPDPLPQPRRDVPHDPIMSRPGGDRGAITLFAVLMCAVLLLAAGLVIDGGAKLTAARQATTLAEEAARAGAEQVNLNQAYLHVGALVDDPSAAVAAARSYLAAAGHPGTVTVTGPASITVTVTISEPTVILSLIGIGTVTTHATATATLVQGVEARGSP